MKKIVVIGPVYPYKGGISHYTGLMVRALKNKYDVTAVSYSMQYPKLLFRKEQRDYANKAFEIEDTRYLINTANPFNIISSARNIREMQPDLVIIQWWHPYFAPCYHILLSHLKGIKVFFVCHNVLPHERFFMDEILTKYALKKGSGYIVHSDEDKDNLVRLFPEKPYRKNVHPTYNAFKMRDMSRQAAREYLGIGESEKILLFFGFVRKYKGLIHLLKAMPEITEHDSNIKLYIVGDFGKDKDEYINLIKEEKLEKKVIVKDGYTPDEEVEPYFAAADLCVCPYESATQSGIVQIAFGFDLPVLATNVGGLPEVVDHGNTGYIVEPKDSQAIAASVADFFDNERSEAFRFNVDREKNRFSWERMVETIEDMYESIDGCNSGNS